MRASPLALWRVLLSAALLLVCLSPGVARADSVARGRVLVRNAEVVITMDPRLGKGPLGIIDKGDVLFEDERIVEVGKGISPRGARVLDATGKIVMPGFVDTHTHLWQSMIRGCGTDTDLNGWLTQCMLAVGQKMNAEQTYNAVRLSTADVISTGVTTVTDWSHSFNTNFVDGNIRALIDSGLRFVYAYAFDFNRETDIRRVKREIIDRNPRARLQLASHPVPENVPAMQRMVQVADELHVDINTHLLENIADRQADQIRSLEQAGALKSTLMVNHAIHLTDSEIALLARRGVRIAHCPLSNMRLASGIIRMPELVNAHIKIGLGLDGGTNDTSDMFNLMRAAVGLQRAKFLKATATPTVAEVLRLATMGGAEVLGMQNEIGSLTPGKKADLIVIDPHQINFAPKVDWLAQIVFNGQPRNVEYVVVHGRFLKAQGRLVNVWEDGLVHAAEKSREELN
ncbi:amidohydrolase family protein [Pendulispora rubella]|uniref:Amidohydrolase family protein n=1 Tax=Pendulispora rubella TaxID=2741070 RepID=A0ABZ2KSM3_9BACT